MRTNRKLKITGVLLLTLSWVGWFGITVDGWGRVVALALGLPLAAYWVYRLWAEYQAPN